MKRFIPIFIFTLFCLSSFAQKLTVESFEEATRDLSASTSPRKDLNDEYCALVKVQIALPDVKFEGSVIGDVEHNVNEYWVYMPAGTKRLKVRHPDYLNCSVTFTDYGINSLQSKTTYELIIVKPELANGNSASPVSTNVQVPQNVNLLPGSAYEQCELGKYYFLGQGVPQSYTDAVKWFTKAAERGNAEAQACLGYCYDKGRGVTQSYEEAVKWYTRAAEKGNSDAQCNLGICYKKGRGVPQSYHEAARWYTMAAEQGNAHGQCNLGICYDSGQGVPQSYQDAVKWYRKAALQGDVTAQYYLGYCYENGQGVTQSYSEAFKWYTDAAVQGDADACNSLAYLNANGQGTKVDFSKAMKFIDKAISIKPHNADYYDSKGEILLMQNRNTEALEIYNKILEINPDFYKDENPDGTDFTNALKEQGLIE